MKDKFTVASPTSVQSIVIRLQERAKWLESRSFATLDASIEREAASTIEELLIELDEANEACKGLRHQLCDQCMGHVVNCETCHSIY